MKINVMVKGREKRHLVEGMGVFKTKEGFLEKYEVAGKIIDSRSAKTKYPMLRGIIIIFTGSEEESNFICEKINQQGGIPSHKAFQKLLDELEKRKETKNEN